MDQVLEVKLHQVILRTSEVGRLGLLHYASADNLVDNCFSRGHPLAVLTLLLAKQVNTFHVQQEVRNPVETCRSYNKKKSTSLLFLD